MSLHPDPLSLSIPPAARLGSPPQPVAAQPPHQRQSLLSTSAHTSASADRVPPADPRSLPGVQEPHEHCQQSRAPQRQHPPRSPSPPPTAATAPGIAHHTAPVLPNVSGPYQELPRRSSPTHTAVRVHSSPPCRASRRR